MCDVSDTSSLSTDRVGCMCSDPACENTETQKSLCALLLECTHTQSLLVVKSEYGNLQGNGSLRQVITRDDDGTSLYFHRAQSFQPSGTQRVNRVQLKVHRSTVHEEEMAVNKWPCQNVITRRDERHQESVSKCMDMGQDLCVINDTLYCLMS